MPQDADDDGEHRKEETANQKRFPVRSRRRGHVEREQMMRQTGDDVKVETQSFGGDDVKLSLDSRQFEVGREAGEGKKTVLV